MYKVGARNKTAPSRYMRLGMRKQNTSSLGLKVSTRSHAETQSSRSWRTIAWVSTSMASMTATTMSTTYGSASWCNIWCAALVYILVNTLPTLRCTGISLPLSGPFRWAILVCRFGVPFWWAVLVGHFGGPFWWAILVSRFGGPFLCAFQKYSFQQYTFQKYFVCPWDLFRWRRRGPLEWTTERLFSKRWHTLLNR